MTNSICFNVDTTTAKGARRAAKLAALLADLLEQEERESKPEPIVVNLTEEQAAKALEEFKKDTGPAPAITYVEPESSPRTFSVSMNDTSWMGTASKLPPFEIPEAVREMERENLKAMILESREELGLPLPTPLPPVRSAPRLVFVPPATPPSVPVDSAFPPLPGTTGEQRIAELGNVAFVQIRKAGVERYQRPNGQPLFTYSESLRTNRVKLTQTVLDHEAAMGWLATGSTHQMQAGAL